MPRTDRQFTNFSRAVTKLDEKKRRLLEMESSPEHGEFLIAYKEAMSAHNQAAQTVKALARSLEFDGKSFQVVKGQTSVKLIKCEVSRYSAATLLAEYPEALEIEGLVNVTGAAVKRAIEYGALSGGATKHKERRPDLDYVQVKGAPERSI